MCECLSYVALFVVVSAEPRRVYVLIAIAQVGWAKRVLKRAGVRPSMHSLLHFKDAILDHGETAKEQSEESTSRGGAGVHGSVP